MIGAAGSVGAPAAFSIATQGLADAIVMLDTRRNVVQQHAMDLATAVSSLDVSVVAGAWEDMAGSDLVVIAAGVQQGLIADRMEMLPGNLPLVCDIARQIERFCPLAIVVTATNPVDPLNYAIWRASGLDRRRLLGYSVNDSFRFRELVAGAMSVKVSRVQATVVGEHGNSQVPLFSSVRIDGRPVRFGAQEKAAVRAQLRGVLVRYEALQAGRTAGWTCAVGLAAMARAVLEDREEPLPCSVILDGEYGQAALSMSVPVRLGRAGVREVVEWPLEPDEQEGLERSVAALRVANGIVDRWLAEARSAGLPRAGSGGQPTD